MSNDRGTGRTSRQMLEAPQGAVFVWCNSRTSYAKSLAASLGRKDLRIESPTLFDYGDRLRGLRVPVVLDHDIVLTSRQWAVYTDWQAHYHG